MWGLQLTEIMEVAIYHDAVSCISSCQTQSCSGNVSKYHANGCVHLLRVCGKYCGLHAMKELMGQL